MSFIKSSSRYSSKTKFPVEKTASFAKGSQVNKNREEIIKNKVYCPVELKDVYKILADADKLLANKACKPDELIEYNEKLNEFINLCQNYKVTTTTPTVKADLKKTFNPIEQNLNYLNKHIEAAKKDSIILKKKIKKFTDPNYLSSLEEKNKQVCSNIEYVKKEIKTLKDNIRKNERLLDTSQKKPNEIVLQKEYKNLLTQQGNLYSRLVQLQSANKVYEENIAKIDAQYEEIKKKLDELNLKKKESEKEKEEGLYAGISVETSKDILEKQIFNLNAKRDNLKREKNNQVNNLTATLAKLRKQIANLENAKIALLNEEKSNIEKYEILKKSLNSKALRANKTEAKIKQKEQKYDYYETKEPEIKETEPYTSNTDAVYSSYEQKQKSPSHFKATNKQSSEDKHFFEDLLAENEEETRNALKNIEYELLKTADSTQEDWTESEFNTQFHQTEKEAICKGKRETAKKIIKKENDDQEMLESEQEQKSDMHQKMDMSLYMGVDTRVEMGQDIDLGFEDDMLLKLQNQLNQKMQKEELSEADFEKDFGHYNDLSMEEFDKEFDKDEEEVGEKEQKEEEGEKEQKEEEGEKEQKEEEGEKEQKEAEGEKKQKEGEGEKKQKEEEQNQKVALDGKGEDGEEPNKEIKEDQVENLYAKEMEANVYEGEIHTDLQEKEKLMHEEMNVSEKRKADKEQVSTEKQNDVEPVCSPDENNKQLEMQNEEPISKNEQSNEKKEEAYKNIGDNNEHVEEPVSEKNGEHFIE